MGRAAGRPATEPGREGPAAHRHRPAPTVPPTNPAGKAPAPATVHHDVIGLLVLGAALAATLVLGLVHHARDGRVRTVGRAGADLRLELSAVYGERATLLQFSSAFCAPCRATRRTLADIAGMVDGVRHVEVDAESHLELVRRLGIAKTPTTLVLDGRGHEVVRASGQPRKADVLAALGRAVGA